MAKPFPSHANYVPYDAIAGKPGKNARPAMVADVWATEPGKADFMVKLEPAWLKRLQAAWYWCHVNGHAFTIPPFAYQVAKVRTVDATFVLYASKRGRARSRFIKVVMEGVMRGDPIKAAADFETLKAMFQ